jgi:hypothetical protein
MVFFEILVTKYTFIKNQDNNEHHFTKVPTCFSKCNSNACLNMYRSDHVSSKNFIQIRHTGFSFARFAVFQLSKTDVYIMSPGKCSVEMKFYSNFLTS